MKCLKLIAGRNEAIQEIIKNGKFALKSVEELNKHLSN